MSWSLAMAVSSEAIETVDMLGRVADTEFLEEYKSIVRILFLDINLDREL